jgi:hypothetical protein
MDVLVAQTRAATASLVLVTHSQSRRRAGRPGAAPGGRRHPRLSHAIGRRYTRPAQVGAHASQQLANTEGFGEVVVSAGIERCDLVRLVDTRRQHDDRHGGPAAHVTDHVQPIAIGQA